MTTRHDQFGRMVALSVVVQIRFFCIAGFSARIINVPRRFYIEIPPAITIVVVMEMKVLGFSLYHFHVVPFAICSITFVRPPAVEVPAM